MCILQNRAQAATELLQELNSDVSGNFVEEVSVNVIKCIVVLLSVLRPGPSCINIANMLRLCLKYYDQLGVSQGAISLIFLVLN